MSKTRDAREETQKALDYKAPRVSAKPVTDLPPLKPRRGLFVLFAILLILLFAGLLTLYFTTVYPNRSKPQSVETDQSAEPGGRK